MATPADVARYILATQGEMSAMKLQKLVYYSQAWALVWNEEPLFEEDFQAWANGPVVPSLYSAHRGQFKVNEATFWTGDVGRLAPEERARIDKVLSFYAQHNAQWLSNLTHQETPWLAARGDLAPGEPSNTVISKSSMHEYYSAL